jgi:hypothetical protein
VGGARAGRAGSSRVSATFGSILKYRWEVVGLIALVVVVVLAGLVYLVI